MYKKGDGKAEITMRDYLEAAIVDSGMDITRTAATPAKRDLFETDKSAQMLDKRTPKLFTALQPNFCTCPYGLAWTSYYRSSYKYQKALTKIKQSQGDF